MAAPSITFGRLDPKDDATVLKMYSVFQRSYQKEAELIGALDFPPLHRTAHDLKRTEAQFFGCWNEDGLAAVVEVAESAAELDIRSLVVDPAFFRQGLASRLLDFVLNFFVWETAVVETAVANGPAIALYQKLGFVEEKRWRGPHGIPKVKLRLRSLRPE